jgi:phosphoribosylanthranilate isomerase
MTRTRVKICGITREADRDAAVDAGADAIGMIVDVPVNTPREITAEEAATLSRGLPPFVTGVLVTMPSSVQDAVALQERVGADAVQIHGGLAPEYVGGLNERLEVPVIASVENQQADLQAYADASDLLLVDSRDDSGAGGTGETHDWEQTRKVSADLDIQIALAGGLTPDNVAEAINAVQPFAVDTASGVEAEGGVKDHESVRDFVETAQGVSG